MVPEPEHRVTFLSQPGFPLCILRHLGVVLSGVHFNDQPLFETNEIYHVRTYRPLSPKLMPVHFAEAKVLPTKSFGIGRVCPQRSSS